jgi:hypothetical protein
LESGKDAIKIDKVVPVPGAQLKYAKLLDRGSSFGMCFLGISYLLYLTGILPSYVPPEKMHAYCSVSCSELVQVLDMPTGWAWLSFIGRADFLGLLGIAFLAGLTIIGYLIFLLPEFIRERDIPYAVMAAAEVLLLALAASGLLAAGLH